MITITKRIYIDTTTSSEYGAICCLLRELNVEWIEKSTKEICITVSETTY